MKLIEAEALLKNRKAEIKARDAGVDPELLVQKRIKDALRKDPEIASLMKEIEQVQRKVDMAKLSNANSGRPSAGPRVAAVGGHEAGSSRSHRPEAGRASAIRMKMMRPFGSWSRRSPR